MTSETRLVAVSQRTYRIQSRRLDGTETASRFAWKAPDAAQAYPSSRFAGWTQKAAPRQDEEAWPPTGL